MAYFGVIFFAFVAPLAVYLVKLRESPFFCFHAADGIRYATVTGVQTCALPISRPERLPTVHETAASPATSTTTPGRTSAEGSRATSTAMVPTVPRQLVTSWTMN